MGSRLSGARAEDEEEEEDEDDDDDEDEQNVAEKSSADSRSRDLASKSASNSIAAPKNFAEIAAEAATKKKKAPAPTQESAGAQFAKLIAAKKAAAKAPKKAPRPEVIASMPTSEQQPSQENGDGELPRGGEGAIWVALEDSPVREDRDIKSAKKGVIQEGEQCTQTGPWRAEPSGRVRMPVRGPRGSEGWVTLDGRRCKSSDGTWGTQAFDFVSDAVAEDEEVEEHTNPVSMSRTANEIDELLDMFGGEEPVKTPPASGKHDKLKKPASGKHDKLKKKNTESSSVSQVVCAEEVAEENVDDVSDGAMVADEDVSGHPDPNDNEQTKVQAVSELTAAEKRLRNVRKKLRELDVLEAKADSLSESQQARLARKPELQQEEQAALAEIAAERKAASSAKKRARKPRKAGASKAKDVERNASSTRRWSLLLFALLPIAFLGVAYLVMKK